MQSDDGRTDILLGGYITGMLKKSNGGRNRNNRKESHMDSYISHEKLQAHQS